ncbi:MAG: helix-hairpin-helix domain-containing protein [Pirellulaceae bacterium]
MNDLTLIEGIGPKIAEHLVAGGYDSWESVAGAAPESLKTVLDAAGPQYQVHDPGTWPRQAALLVDGKWKEFKELTDLLDGGVMPS